MDDMNNNIPQSPIPPYQPPYQAPTQDQIPPYQPPYQAPVQEPVQQTYQAPQDPIPPYQPPYQAPAQEPVQQVYQQPYQQPVYQQPYQAQPAAGSGKGLAIASLVLGIVALCLCCVWFLSIPAAIVGVILGVIALKKQAPGRGMAIAGLIMSIIGCILAIIFIVIAIVAVNQATSSLYDWYNLFEDYGYYY